MEYRLELLVVPVSDVDRAKAFYERCGFHVDLDLTPLEGMRIVQLTPPGSSCSIMIGTGVTDAAPGSYRRTHLVVRDVVAARAELVARGVDVSDVRHFDREAEGWRSGPDPARGRYASFADFADPDGNTWVLQEVPEGS